MSALITYCFDLIVLWFGFIIAWNIFTGIIIGLANLLFKDGEK